MSESPGFDIAASLAFRFAHRASMTSASSPSSSRARACRRWCGRAPRCRGCGRRRRFIWSCRCRRTMASSRSQCGCPPSRYAGRS